MRTSAEIVGTVILEKTERAILYCRISYTLVLNTYRISMIIFSPKQHSHETFLLPIPEFSNVPIHASFKCINSAVTLFILARRTAVGRGQKRSEEKGPKRSKLHLKEKTRSNGKSTHPGTNEEKQGPAARPHTGSPLDRSFRAQGHLPSAPRLQKSNSRQNWNCAQSLNMELQQNPHPLAAVSNPLP